MGTKRQTIQIQDCSTKHNSTNQMTIWTRNAYFMNVFPLPLCFSRLFFLYFSSLHLWMQKSRLLRQICTHLPKALFNSQVPDRILFLTHFPLVPYIWEMCCFERLDFWFIRMLRNKPREGNTITFSKQSSGVFVTLQKFLVVSDIQLPPFPELCLPTRPATYFEASILGWWRI